MATDIVADQFPDAPPDETAVTPDMEPKYTPDDHEKAAPALKVTHLVQLGSNVYGKTATFEFTGGFVKSIDVDAKSVWHSMFRDIGGAEWWKLLDHVAPRRREADGTVLVQQGPMSFWTQRTTLRGRDLARSYFDVPKENYSAGRLTGAKTARELILFLKEYERAREAGPFGALERDIQACLQEAFSLRGVGYSSTPSGRHAAVTFCEIITRYFYAASTRDANADYLDDLVKREEESLAWSLADDERHRQVTAERMRAVRAAKVAKRGDLRRGQFQQTSEGASSNGHTLQ